MPSLTPVPRITPNRLAAQIDAEAQGWEHF